LAGDLGGCPKGSASGFNGLLKFLDAAISDGRSAFDARLAHVQQLCRRGSVEEGPIGLSSSVLIVSMSKALNLRRDHRPLALIEMSTMQVLRHHEGELGRSDP
jgi:hypothetical protein